jgi:hypothetical protein
MIDIEMKIKYFNAETLDSVEFTKTFNTDATDMDTARSYAAEMLQTERETAYNHGAMMDTFYYEYDFLVPQELMEAV